VPNEPQETLAQRVRRRLAAAAAAGARVQAAVLLTLVYWLVIGPAALAGRLLGADPLARRKPATTGWVPRPARNARDVLQGPG
jgi:hypothetical protein